MNTTLTDKIAQMKEVYLMIKKMSSIILSIILFAFFLILGCTNTDTEKIEFVKQGIPQFLSLSENCKQQENYLQTGNPFFINTEKK